MASAEHAQSQRANRRFIKWAMAAPMLAQDEEIRLASAFRDHRDPAALHRLTQAHMRLVIARASRFRNYGLPMGDLIQEGNIGLMQAALRFDPAREVRFSTYASWWIRAAIQDFVLRNWSIVRTGTTSAHKSLFFNLRRLRARISGAADGPMTRAARAEIARTLGVDVRDVEEMEGRMTAGDRSLNATLGEEGEAEWQDSLADDRALPDETIIEWRDGETRTRWLKDALKSLSPRELSIIRARRLTDHARTLEELGEKLGISKERVRQIEVQAMKKLKAALIARVGDPVAAGLIGA